MHVRHDGFGRFQPCIILQCDGGDESFGGFEEGECEQCGWFGEFFAYVRECGVEVGPVGYFVQIALAEGMRGG